MLRRIRKPITTKQTMGIVFLINKARKVLTIAAILGLMWAYVPWQLIEAQVNDNEITTEEFDINSILEEESPFYMYDVPVEFEDELQRTETTKTFRKIDGTYEVAMYNDAIHFYEDGKWKQVDNSLFDNGSEYETKDNKFKLKFPKKLDDNKQVKLTMDGYSIDWNVLNITSSPIEYDNEVITPSNIKELVNINQSVLYPNIQENVDIEYIITGSKVKENIILNQYVEDFSMTFEYKLNDLSLTEDENGNIVFINENNEVVFLFSDLFMIDKEMNESFDVSYTLVETGNKTYEVTITPNDEWLQTAVYPVEIDPTLNSNTTTMSIFDTYISESNPTTKYSSLEEMKISSTSYSDEYRGLLYFYIPSSVMDKVITYGGMKLYKYPGKGTIGSEINVYKNTEIFASSSVTWDSWITGGKKYEDRVIDFHSVGDSDEYVFDITKAVKEWQETGNTRTTGFTIGVDSNYGSVNSVYQNHSNSGVYKPVIEIGYVESSGLTENWTYHSQNAGFAGTGYTNDYTGNLTFIHNVYSGNHELFPYNLNLVFDNQLKNEDVGMGLGWRTNYNMTAFWDSTVNMVQVLDGDGSMNFFRYIQCSDIGEINTPYQTCYIAEDGSGQKLFRDNYTHKLHYDSPDHFGYTFNSNGKLEKIHDLKNDKDIILGYHSTYTDKLTTITDAAGNYASLYYGSDGSLDLQRIDIYNQGDRIEIIYPQYSGDSLTGLKHLYDYNLNNGYSEGNYVDFTYETGKLKTVNTFENYLKSTQTASKVTYEYDLQNRVISVVNELNSAETGRMDISYELGTTEFMFNDFTAVNYVDEVCFYKYYQYASFPGANSSTGSICLYIENTPYTDLRSPYDYSFRTYYRNPDLTTPVYPTTSLDGYAFKTDGNPGETFIKEAKGFVDGESTVTNTNQGKVRYTFDNYGHTINVVDDNGNAQFYEYANIFRGVSSPEQANYMMNNKLLKVSSPQKSSFGDLEGTFVENRVNLVQNGTFNSGTSYWTTYGASSVTLTTDDFYDNVLGGTGIRLSGDSDYTGYIEQIVTTDANVGDTFTFGGWMMGEATPLKNDDIRKFTISLKLEIGYYGGSGWKTVPLDFNPNITDWQYAMTDYTIPEPENSYYIYTGKVKVVVEYRGENYVYIDGVQVYKEPFGTEYFYDDSDNYANEDGKVNSISLDGTNCTTDFDYNGPFGEISSATSCEDTFSPQYDVYGKALEVMVNNVKQSFEYDSSSQNLTKVRIGSSTSYFDTNTSYDIYDLYSDKVIDEFGLETDFNFNTITGLLEELELVKGNVTLQYADFIYDDFGVLKSVKRALDAEAYAQDPINYSGGFIQSDYEYNEFGNVEKITIGDLGYTLNYDSYGRLLNVKVEGVSIMEYSYVDDYNGDGVVDYLSSVIETQIYGNGDEISFKYDNEGRVEDIFFNNIKTSSYEYNETGQIAVYKVYYSNGTIKEQLTYNYSLSGAIKSIEYYNGDKVEYSYDSKGNLSEYKFTVGSVLTQINYAFDSQTGNRSADNGTAILDYIYEQDALNRLDKIQLVIGTSTLEKDYEYFEGSEVLNGTSSTRVKKITYNFLGNLTYEYLYDDLGNISEIKYGGEQQNFHYDDLNQLIREDNTVSSRSTKYVYDNNGNITAIYSHAYTNPTFDITSSPIEFTIMEYNYNWTDQVSKITEYVNFNIVSQYQIIYDNSGNPISYTDLLGNDDVTFDWQGKNLIEYSDDSKTITYTYNDQGYRTSKTVNGITTIYVLDGSRLIYQSDGSNEMHYSYDVDGTVIGVKFNGSDYVYVKNNLGDITHILDSSGNEVVSYDYDAWGNILSIDGSMKDSLGNQNPFRYRGYKFDEDTNFYYLNSRYYNPSTGRFINADVIVGSTGSTLGHNMYSYALNNPVKNVDEDGYFWHIVGGFVVGAAIEFTSQVIDNVLEGKDWNEDINVGAILIAGAGGALSAALPGMGFISSKGAQLAAGWAVDTMTDVAISYVKTGLDSKEDWYDVGISALTNTMTFGFKTGRDINMKKSVDYIQSVSKKQRVMLYKEVFGDSFNKTSKKWAGNYAEKVVGKFTNAMNPAVLLEDYMNGMIVELTNEMLD